MIIDMAEIEPTSDEEFEALKAPHRHRHPFTIARLMARVERAENLCRQLLAERAA